MKIRATVTALVLLWGGAALAGDLQWNRNLQKGCSQDLVHTYGQVCEPMGMKPGRTGGFRLERPALTVQAGAGELWSESPDGVGPRGYYFQGPAKISFSVEDGLEQEHLALFIDGGRELKEVAVDSLYILPLGPGGDLPVPEGVEEKLLVPGSGEYLNFKNAFHEDGIAWTDRVLNAAGASNQDLVVLFRMKERIWAYVLDSKQEEEVSLRRLAPPPGAIGWWWDRVVSLHRTASGKLVRGLASEERAAKFDADTQRYELDYRFDEDGKLLEGSSCTVKVKLLRPARTLLFSMLPLLTVSKVTLADGSPVPFLKEDYSKKYFQNTYDLLVALPEGATGELSLTFSLSGKLFENFLGLRVIEDATSWYPGLSDLDGAQFAFKATTTKGYEAVSVGDLVEHRTGLAGEGELWSYEMKYPIHVAGMLLGKFTHMKTQAAGIELDVMVEDRVRMEYFLTNQKTVLKEMKNAAEAYTRLFGPIPYKTIRAGMGLGNTSLGTPTLLVLGPYIFDRSEGITSWPEQTVAHEMAHQWWYNQVTPASYRDAWVSEALAEYSSFLCIRDVHEWTEAKRYIDDNHEQMNRWSHLTGKTYVDFGPIAMGSRLWTTLDPDSAYQRIVYYKGAWIILYLSKIAAFLKGGEESFMAGLRDLCANSAGRRISADDFRKTLEKHMGVDLKWFFQEWMEGTGLPEVKITTKVEGSGAQTKLLVSGTQDTDMVLPIPIDALQGDKVRQFLFFLKGKSSQAEFALPFKPDKVKVDGFMVVPADFKK